MKYLILVIALIFAIGVNPAIAQQQQEIKNTGKVNLKKPAETPKAAETKKADKAQSAAKGKSAKPTKGYIASLNHLIKGGDGRVTKEEAEQLADKGNPIVFVTGSGKSAKVYFVYNEDGTYAGKKMAKYAHNKFVGIVGKAKSQNGLNYIIMTMIDSM